MKIYTKTGDQGETSLANGKRIRKDSLRIEAYGTVDELNSILGVCRSLNSSSDIDKVLQVIQNDLFTIGSELATPPDSKQKKKTQLKTSSIDFLERQIDSIDPTLKPLKNFVLPGGSEIGSMLHFARTVCRRAERLIVRLASEESTRNEIVVYLNRLSDLLFVMARWTNSLSNIDETIWLPE